MTYEEFAAMYGYGADDPEAIDKIFEELNPTPPCDWCSWMACEEHDEFVTENIYGDDNNSDIITSMAVYSDLDTSTGGFIGIDLLTVINLTDIEEDDIDDYVVAQMVKHFKET